MDEIMRVVNLALAEFKKEFGEDAKLEDGDEFVTVLNNCTLIISLEDGNFKTHFIGGVPYKVDVTLSIYKEEL